MYDLYDIGYLDVRKVEKLNALLVLLDAYLVDVRFSPNSRDPQWRQAAMKKEIGERYIHIKSLGNKNYKGGPIEFLDLPGGLDALAHLLQKKNVVVMCACWARDRCHRLNIVQEFEREYGIHGIPITRERIKELTELEQLAPPPSPQLTLF